MQGVHVCFAERVGGKVVEAAVIVELPTLKGREKLPNGCPLFVLVEMQEESHPNHSHGPSH